MMILMRETCFGSAEKLLWRRCVVWVRWERHPWDYIDHPWDYKDHPWDYVDHLQLNLIWFGIRLERHPWVCRNYDQAASKVSFPNPIPIQSARGLGKLNLDAKLFMIAACMYPEIPGNTQEYPEIHESKNDTRKYPVIYFTNLTWTCPLPSIFCNTRPNIEKPYLLGTAPNALNN